MKQRDLEILAQTSTQHQATLASQAAETAEMHAAITSIATQRDTHATHRDNLRAEIKVLQKQIAQRQSAQTAHARDLDAQSRLNVPELDFWETYLGMRIEGAGQADRLKFVFCCVNESEWQREAWFELDTEKREYGVTCCRPKVEEAEVEAVLERLNETRDLGRFLKGDEGGVGQGDEIEGEGHVEIGCGYIWFCEVSKWPGRSGNSPSMDVAGRSGRKSILALFTISPQPVYGYARECILALQ